jgi:hypothetical protein
MVQRISIFLLLSALICLAAPQTSVKNTDKKTPELPCELTSNDYAVYTALINQLGKPEDPEEAWQDKEMLIADTTDAPHDLKNTWGGWGSTSKASPSQETLDDLIARAPGLCPVKSQFGDPQSYIMITRVELDKTFKKGAGGWDGFYKKHPKGGGFWTFSRPGYNVAGDEAVLYVSHSCGNLCGTGHLYFLVKRNGQWSVKNRTMLWIS